jgi:hypothetical protein
LAEIICLMSSVMWLLRTELYLNGSVSSRGTLDEMLVSY